MARKTHYTSQIDSANGFSVNDVTVIDANGNTAIATEALTTTAPALSPFGSSSLDSTANAVDGTLAAGTYIGQVKVIVMTEASNSSTVTIANHVTSDPEVATFDAVDETGVFMWTGTEWATIYATCTFA